MKKHERLLNRGGGPLSAFTLAETLITLAIIGVVAAITMPTLIAKYQEYVLVTQVKKAYSEFQNALKLYAAQNDCSDISCISDTNQTTDELVDKLFKQFQGAIKCEFSYDRTRNVCRAAQIKSNTPYYRDGVTTWSDTFSPRIISANKVAYHLIQYNECLREVETDVYDKDGFKTGEKQKVTRDVCALFYIDANGTNKGPNQRGADIYVFQLDSKGKFQESYINNVLTTGKLNYTPYEFGKSKE